MNIKKMLIVCFVFLFPSYATADCDGRVLRDTASVNPDGTTSECIHLKDFKGKPYDSCPFIMRKNTIFLASQKHLNKESGVTTLCEHGGSCWRASDITINGRCRPGKYIDVDDE
jgi:hypothetical protein